MFRKIATQSTLWIHHITGPQFYNINFIWKIAIDEQKITHGTNPPITFHFQMVKVINLSSVSFN